MFRGPPRLIYVRWIGALCSFAPLLLFILLSALLRILTFEAFMWAFLRFSPMILFGYFLDVIYKHIPKVSKSRYPIVQIIAGWLISFPLSQMIGEFLYYLIIRDPSYLILYSQDIVGTLLGLILLGLIYSFFFYSVYMIFLRWYLVRKLEPYMKSRQEAKPTPPSKKKKKPKEKKTSS
ncbi:MAG: hypothetical protein DRZ80_02340 [Thermoprotei archaeon]|nr:MAG: hypothetical protein DRZ80_02340 [Thermoprotei archaeon]